jgi:hypothetical protein
MQPHPPSSSLYGIIAILHDERRLESVHAVPYGDHIESTMEVGLKRAGRLRQSVLRSAFEEGCDDVG